MDLKKLQQKLLSAARQEVVSERVPYAFEQRIMARLPKGRPVDLTALWARALWRAAAICAVISILLNFWSFSWPEDTSVVTLETAVLSAAEQLSETW